MGLQKRVHTYNDKGQITKVQPYVLFREKGEPTYFLQSGKFYTEDGKEQEKVPEWVLSQADSLSKKVQQEVNYKRGRNGNNQSDRNVD